MAAAANCDRPPHGTHSAGQNDDPSRSVLLGFGGDAIKERDRRKEEACVVLNGQAAGAIAVIPGRGRESVRAGGLGGSLSSPPAVSIRHGKRELRCAPMPHR
eukprot:1476149-Rhodomonas_salina.5